MFFYKLGVDEVDYSLYPKREHQLKFIAVYLEAAAKLRGTVWCDAASSLVQFEIILNFQHIPYYRKLTLHEINANRL